MVEGYRSGSAAISPSDDSQYEIQGVTLLLHDARYFDYPSHEKNQRYARDKGDKQESLLFRCVT